MWGKEAGCQEMCRDGKTDQSKQRFAGSQVTAMRQSTSLLHVVAG